VPPPHNFEHLPLILTYHGEAVLTGGSKEAQQTKDNKNARRGHSGTLRRFAESLGRTWREQQAAREQDNLPTIPEGVPFLLQVDPDLDLDELRRKFAFEIVSEDEQGFVIVAAEDIDLDSFLEMVDGFAGEVYGSGVIAKVHSLHESPTDRLRYILSDNLFNDWPNIADDQIYLVDVGIACVGTREIPKPLKRWKRDTDETWQQRQENWSDERLAAYDTWDELKRSRETDLEQFAAAYQADILHVVDGNTVSEAVLADSFTVRLQISGLGLKDLVLNYPFIFEVVEPDDVELPQNQTLPGAPIAGGPNPLPPADDAPAVCVIDSGIQEEHILIAPAIDAPTSHCFLPSVATNDVGDFVEPNGHGTRVAGAVLYGETVAADGQPQLPFWIQNARVLDEDNGMPYELFPPELIRTVVEKYHEGPRHTRIFNHSINATSYCRVKHMSAWAAEMDLLCAQYDILIIQAAGNLRLSRIPPHVGIIEHLIAGRPYPLYLLEASSRVANPAQSLQALTVGSIAYGHFVSGDWVTFAINPSDPSAFSRSGLGIWNVIKPEVVEFGGDAIHTNNVPPDIQGGGLIDLACPELVRSTLLPGPLSSRDEPGTSFAAPKVSRIAARLQELLSDEPALLYRALIVQSARWPTWAQDLLNQLRETPRDQREELYSQVLMVIRTIGYGLPDEERATGNTHYRSTFITSGDRSIHAGDGHIYQVPIPAELRRTVDEFDIRIDVTLSYAAQPRRTRRNLRHYMSTWVDWKSSRLWEELDSFRDRALKNQETADDLMEGSTLPWTLQTQTDAGLVRGVRRNTGTVQKDWAVVKSNDLPDQFCIAVVGHQGWSRDPEATANYSLAVTFEILGQEIQIYEPLRTALLELQAEVEGEVEAQVEIEAGE
jgi:hypothetical protein